MAHAQYAFTSPSPLDLTKRVLFCLAAVQGSAKQKKVAEPPSCTEVRYERADESRYTTASRETCIVDSKTATWLRFQKLSEEWKKQCGAQSSINETVVMPAYQEIIGMGEKVVPFLIAQLQSEGSRAGPMVLGITSNNRRRILSHRKSKATSKRWPKRGLGGPKKMLGSWSPDELPGLNPKSCTITSEAAPGYNCVSWAAKDQEIFGGQTLGLAIGPRVCLEQLLEALL